MKLTATGHKNCVNYRSILWSSLILLAISVIFACSRQADHASSADALNLVERSVVPILISDWSAPKDDDRWAAMTVSFVDLGGKLPVDNKLFPAAKAQGGKYPSAILAGNYAVFVTFKNAAGQIVYQDCNESPSMMPIVSESFRYAFPVCRSRDLREPLGEVVVEGKSASAPSADATTPKSQPVTEPPPNAPVPSPAKPSETPSPVDFHVVGKSPFSIHDYGETLKQNKLLLHDTIDLSDATPTEKALLLAIAMQRSVMMSLKDRDASQDGNPSALVSLYKINFDMLQQLGYQQADFGSSLNDPSRISEATQYLLKAFRSWGIASTLDYLRGGRSAYADGVSYGAPEFRRDIATIYEQIAADVSLERDGRRVEILVSDSK